MSCKRVENFDEFEFDPEGLRVLAVDDSAVCLKTLVALLEKCRYKVSATTDANEALKLLRENKDGFDIVLTDVVRSDMDGFTLMEIIRDEMDIPVISSDDRKNVMKGVNKGASDYLLKPPRMEEIRNIWQHVVRKKLSDQRANNKATTTSYNIGIPTKHHSISNNIDVAPVDETINAAENKDINHPQHPAITCYKRESSSSKVKKRRVHWSPEMHAKFVEVVQPLGVFTGAVPKKILELMSEYPDLTRENVASHLQKYRRMLLTQKNVANADPNTASHEAAYQQRPGEMQSYNHMTHPGKLQNPQDHTLVQPHFLQGHHYFAAAEQQGMMVQPLRQFPADTNWVVDYQNRIRSFDPQHYYQPQQQCGEHNYHRQPVQVYSHSHVPDYGSSCYEPPALSCFRPSSQPVLPTSIPSFSRPGIDLPCLPDHNYGHHHHHQMPGQATNFSSMGIENQGFGQQVPAEDVVTETSFSSFSSADDEIANLVVEFNRNDGVPQL